MTGYPLTVPLATPSIVLVATRPMPRTMPAVQCQMILIRCRAFRRVPSLARVVCGAPVRRADVGDSSPPCRVREAREPCLRDVHAALHRVNVNHAGVVATFGAPDHLPPIAGFAD